jgi:Bacterial aa3 type cytochrome c oxidase subunit IV
MAEHDSHYVHGSMDMSQHKRGYSGFLTGVKWTLILILGIMAFLAVFRTHN